LTHEKRTQRDPEQREGSWMRTIPCWFDSS
jgi:hypothetical protein